MIEIKPPQGIRIGQTAIGRGVIAEQDLTEGQVIEVCPILNFDDLEGESLLNDYIVATNIDEQGSTLMLGYGSLYNHSEQPNAEYTWLSDEAYQFSALEDIEKGEEITISYGEEWWEDRGIEPQ